MKAMPTMSSSSPAALLKLRKDHEDCLFLIGKSKDAVGENNTDSLAEVAASLTDRDLFKMWCTMHTTVYSSKEEKSAGSVSSRKLLHGPQQVVSIVPVMLIEPQMNWK